MTARTRRALLATTLAVGVVGAGCTAPASTITATGRVQSDTVTAQAPTLTVPAVNLDAGFVVTASSANRSSVPSLLGFATAGRVSAVEVRLGDQVAAGDVLVRFDDAALAVAVTEAKADQAVARAQLGVLDRAIATTRDKESDLKDKRQEITDGMAEGAKARKKLTRKLAEATTARADLRANLKKATKTRSDLLGKLADADAAAKQLRGQLATVEKKLSAATVGRADLARQLADVEAALAALPPDAPAEVRDPLLAAQRQLTAALAELDQGITQLKAARTKLRTGIKEVDAGRAALTAGLKQVTAGIAKLETALATVGTGITRLTEAIGTIDANLAKARKGLKQVDKGIDALQDARAGLKRTRRLAVIAADDATAVKQAVNARERAVVTAPRAGTVTSVVHAGDVLAPGATVAELSSPAHVVQLWLAPGQAGRVCVGDAATLAGGGAGTVSRILPLAEYPPTYQTTDEVHLTRAVPVEVTVDTALPPGVPVDVQLSPCRTNEVKK